jgi:Cu/Ag efflux pump CusA
MFGDLAATVAIGVMFATVLTLVMVPIFYLNFETGNFATFLHRLWRNSGEKLSRLPWKRGPAAPALGAVEFHS